MSEREFYLRRHAAEQRSLFRVVDAVPTSHADYRPHERSPSARQLLWTLAAEQAGCCRAVDEGRIDWDEVEPPPLDEARELLKRSYTALGEKVAALDEAAWSRSVQFWAGGKKARDLPLGQLLWFFLFDAIHHRGQLSTYLRPMGATVPAIYGSSADDPEPAGL